MCKQRSKCSEIKRGENENLKGLDLEFKELRI
jgi:hypothetical protein